MSSGLGGTSFLLLVTFTVFQGSGFIYTPSGLKEALEKTLLQV
jgi:hypothetical protein